MKKIIAFGFLLFITYSCVPNSPELPEWETKWDVHLPLEDFTMVDAIDDSLIFADTTDSGIPILKLEVSDTTERHEIKRSDLGIEGSTDNFSGTIGDYEVLDEETVSLDEVSVWELLPVDSSTVGDNLPPYLDTDANPPAQRAEFTKFLKVETKTGKLVLSFHNNTFIAIRPGMEIQVNNDTINTDLIGTALFSNDIPAGATVESEPIDLTNITMYNKLELKYSVPVKGNDSSTPLTPDDKKSSFFIDITVRNLVVNSAVAKIPELEYEKIDSVEIEEQDVKLKRGLIDKGSIKFTLTNHLPVSAVVEIVLPDVVKDGQPFTMNYQLPAPGTETQTVDIKGYELFNHKSPGDYIEHFYYNIKSTTVATEDYIEVKSDDSISVDVERDSLIFSSFEGEIDTVNFDFDPVETDGIDMFDEIEGEVRLNALQMVLEFRNEINIPIYINMAITGYKMNETGNRVLDSVRIELKDQEILPSGIADKTIITLDKDSQSPSIVDLVAIKPDKIMVRGNGYAVGEGSVNVGDGIQIFYRVESPLTVMLSDSLLADRDIETITEEDIDEDMQKTITEEILEVSLNVDLENSMPLGVNALIILATDSTDLYSTVVNDSSKKIVIDEIVDAGIVDNTGFVQTTTMEKISIPLSNTQLQIFKNLPIYIRQVYKIPPTNSDVSVRQSDGVTIDGKISFKVLVNNKEE